MVQVTILCLLGVLCSLQAQAESDTWSLIRGPSAVTFKVKHLLFFEVDGRFRNFSGSVDCEDGDFANASIQVTIDANSVYTGNRDRDQHLREEDFFFTEKFPEMRFASKSVRRTGDETYLIVGDLTIRGVTREIELQAEQIGSQTVANGERIDFRATGSVNRYDYGLRWNELVETGKALVGEDVEISLDVAMIKET